MNYALSLRYVVVCSYLKYLAKKFLKKSNLRDFIRVISHEKNSYQLRYFKVGQDEEEDDDDDDDDEEEKK